MLGDIAACWLLFLLVVVLMMLGHAFWSAGDRWLRWSKSRETCGVSAVDIAMTYAHHRVEAETRELREALNALLDEVYGYVWSYGHDSAMDPCKDFTCSLCQAIHTARKLLENI